MKTKEISQMSVFKDWQKYIKSFLHVAKNRCESDIEETFDNLKIVCTDDIYKYVSNIDYQYAESYIKNKVVYALYYITKDNNKEIIVSKNRTLENFLMDILHEYVHYLDYEKYSSYVNSLDFRKLQDDTYFRYWTEFHATFLTYYYAIYNIENLNAADLSIEIINDFEKKNDYDSLIDTTIRFFGSYIALYLQAPCDIDIYPQNCIFNKKYKDIYDFLLDYYQYSVFIKKYNIWKELIDKVYDY